ncbi:MAG: hypothetical protein AB7F89_26420, partial [Pirellulaceae bacterium]
GVALALPVSSGGRGWPARGALAKPVPHVATPRVVQDCEWSGQVWHWLCQCLDEEEAGPRGEH